MKTRVFVAHVLEQSGICFKPHPAHPRQLHSLRRCLLFCKDVRVSVKKCTSPHVVRLSDLPGCDTGYRRFAVTYCLYRQGGSRRETGSTVQTGYN
jgi:hypothetical protein